MRLRRFAAVFLCVAVPLLTGGFQASTLVKLNPDGSGTVEQTTTVMTKTIARFDALGAANGYTEKSNPDDLFSIEEARSAADNMGSGVTFISASRIDTPDRKGIKAVYAFKDIRTLSLKEMTPPAGAGTYRLAEDTDDDGEGDDDADGKIDAAGHTFLSSFPKTVEYAIETNFEDKIINFDRRGFVQPRGQALGGTICLFTDNAPDYDCIVISQTRINIGKLSKQPNDGGVCNSGNCDIK